jgi:V/A-type H+-transporting ATPase subunit F
MVKIAVMGCRETVIGFKALGLDVFPVEEGAEAKQLLRRLAQDTVNTYAIIYVEENLAEELDSEIEKYKDKASPAIILIPGKDGPLGLGQSALRAAVERAVGSDIL